MKEPTRRPLDNSLKLIAFAQNAEDVVLYRAFCEYGEGFYVDVGAGDPVEGSVTKNLIDHLGWSGLDIEPQAALAARLEAAHPRSTVLRVAIGATDGLQTLYRLADNWGMSTLDPAIAERHRRAGWKVVEEAIMVRRLDTVLAEAQVPRIDLLKVDVEGLEKEVFASIDLQRWQPSVIVAEATVPATTIKTHQAWEQLILHNGYKLCLFDGLNRFYVRSGLPELAAQLAIPANVFDRYIQLHWWRQLSPVARRAVDPGGRFASI